MEKTSVNYLMYVGMFFKVKKMFKFYKQIVPSLNEPLKKLTKLLS